MQEAPFGLTERGFFLCDYRYSTLHFLDEPTQTLLEPLQILPVAVRLRVCHQPFKAMYLLDVVILLRHGHYSSSTSLKTCADAFRLLILTTALTGAFVISHALHANYLCC